MRYMAKKAISLRLDEDLWARVVAEADRLGQKRTTFVERALESALPAALAQQIQEYDEAKRAFREEVTAIKSRTSPPASPGADRLADNLARQARLNKPKGM